MVLTGLAADSCEKYGVRFKVAVLPEKDISSTLDP